jgi:hypothetical protein
MGMPAVAPMISLEKGSQTNAIPIRSRREKVLRVGGVTSSLKFPSAQFILFLRIPFAAS